MTIAPAPTVYDRRVEAEIPADSSEGAFLMTRKAMLDNFTYEHEFNNTEKSSTDEFSYRMIDEMINYLASRKYELSSNPHAVGLIDQLHTFLADDMNGGPF